jgi:hydrogenase expression/formation protein HypD
MKYIDEYRDADKVKQMAEAIHRIVTTPHTLMEICGGQTHAIIKYGLDTLLPAYLRLVHGPGCPVCVTPLDLIDKALLIAARPEVIFCSFGDMLRVPGSVKDLLSVKAEGGDVRIVYSPLDALKLARQFPEREVVFFSVGFETTAPATAMAVYHAKQQNLKNFSMLVSHVLVPPAMQLILSSPHNQIQGFLAAGHVCTVMGYAEYEGISSQYSIPIVVTGFEPLDILQGILMCVKQLEDGRTCVENQYSRSVRRDGNVEARRLLEQVFCITHRNWRGIGQIPNSGLALSDQYTLFDAEKRFALEQISVQESSECRGGEVLQGLLLPNQCPAFAHKCTPECPLGAPMVSSEGACAAYYSYRTQGLSDV